MPAFEILQVTAQYSNAVLLAVMPHVSDFAAKQELPISPLFQSVVFRNSNARLAAMLWADG